MHSGISDSPRFPKRKGDVFRHAHRIEKRAALEENPDFFPNRAELPLGKADDVLPFHEDLPRSWLHQADEVLQKDALARRQSGPRRTHRLAMNTCQDQCREGYYCRADGFVEIADEDRTCRVTMRWRRKSHLSVAPYGKTRVEQRSERKKFTMRMDKRADHHALRGRTPGSDRPLPRH